jgi:hypothetical protein
VASFGPLDENKWLGFEKKTNGQFFYYCRGSGSVERWSLNYLVLCFILQCFHVYIEDQYPNIKYGRLWAREKKSYLIYIKIFCVS